MRARVVTKDEELHSSNIHWTAAAERGDGVHLILFNLNHEADALENGARGLHVFAPCASSAAEGGRSSIHSHGRVGHGTNHAAPIVRPLFLCVCLPFFRVTLPVAEQLR